MARDVRLRKLIDFVPGDAGDCFALLVGKDRGATRDGKPYYRVTFRDAGRTVTAMVWHDSPFFADCEAAWRKGEYYKLRGRYGETSYGPQLDLDRVRVVLDDDKLDGFDPDDFYVSTRFDAAALFRALVRLVEEEIADESLRRLVVGLLAAHETELLRLPAAAHTHHAFAGGWLEHALAVARTAVFLADRYCELHPQVGLSKDLVVAGAVLHDVGKVAELDVRPTGSDYTPAGRLIGHILLGRDLVRDAARSIDGFDAETLLRLEHILVSHHDTAEMGSPIPPSTPEALLVHHANEIDAKFAMMAAALEAPSAGDPFTGRDNPLRRPLFRGLNP